MVTTGDPHFLATDLKVDTGMQWTCEGENTQDTNGRPRLQSKRQYQRLCSEIHENSATHNQGGKLLYSISCTEELPK